MPKRVHPDVSLAYARDKRGEARKLLAENIDPGAVRDAHARAATANSHEFGRIFAPVSQS
jgi:hypothetical protein